MSINIVKHRTYLGMIVAHLRALQGTAVPIHRLNVETGLRRGFRKHVSMHGDFKAKRPRELDE